MTTKTPTPSPLLTRCMYSKSFETIEFFHLIQKKSLVITFFPLSLPLLKCFLFWNLLLELRILIWNLISLHFGIGKDQGLNFCPNSNFMKNFHWRYRLWKSLQYTISTLKWKRVMTMLSHYFWKKYHFSSVPI